MIEIITKVDFHQCKCQWCSTVFKFQASDTQCDDMYLTIKCPVCKNKLKLKDNQGTIYNDYRKC